MQVCGTADSVVLLTGGGSGVGAATCRMLSAAGFRVVICGRRLNLLEEVRQSCRSPDAIDIQALDVTDRDRAQSVVDFVVAKFGRVDVLVNNAGINIRNRALSKVTYDDWDRVLSVNATGPFNLISGVLPHMRAQQRGLIVNVSSIAAVGASERAGVAYSASKHALSALTKMVTVEDGKNGIRATEILPGEINTDFFDNRPEPVPAARRLKVLQPDDIAAAILFVATLPDRVHVPQLSLLPANYPS